MPASTILVLESADAGAESLAPILTTAGYTVTRTTDPEEAFAKVAENQLAVVDVGKPAKGAKTAFDLCREIRATPSMSAVPILCVAATDDVEERIGFLEAGADDVVARPFDGREVEARVEALLLRFQRSRELAPVVSADGLTLAKPRRTVAVYSPKGGVGTTTIATNIAVAAAQRRMDRVVLVDLDLQFGSVATHLNLEPKQTLADVIRDVSAMREPELLRSYAARHDSGLHVLAAPPSPDASEQITPDHVSHILATLLEGYDAVVVDAGSVLDERALRVFDAAETIVLPVHPEMSSLKAVHGLLDYLNETGSIGGKSTFVLNNMFAREVLKPRDIESVLGTRITSDLPYDPFLYLKAVNEGVPIVLGAPRSPAAERLVKLSTSAFGADGFVVPEPVAEKRQRRFGFGRRN
jgi:pilus assembly protein CpaE